MKLTQYQGTGEREKFYNIAKQDIGRPNTVKSRGH